VADTLLTFEAAALRLRDRILLAGTSWRIRAGEHWAVLGPNGSGKSTLMGAVAGQVPVVRGRLRRLHPSAAPVNIGHVSFERHRRLMEQEEGRDDARHFSGDPDGMTTAADILSAGRPPGDSDPDRIEATIRQMGIGHLMNRGIRQLSTGEMRKVLIVRALVRSSGILILDEPFDGLDVASRASLMETLSRLLERDMPVLLVVHRTEEIPGGITHVLRLSECRMAAAGPRTGMEGMDRTDGRSCSLPDPVGGSTAQNGPGDAPLRGDAPLVAMRNTSVRYGDQTLFSGLDWRMEAGENWLILGPNGSGKTTLLKLIAGDHPQAYANDIRLFGRPRGSGESIWEIKQRIGLVSSEFQIRYRKSVSALEAVVSGFFDSVGLYRRAAPDQISAARRWLAALGMADKADRPVTHLSCGEQRLILIARAMVKCPDLLILDEPCQGLDTANRDRVLGLAEAIGNRTGTNLIFVTHHPEEVPGCITHMLAFRQTPEGPFTATAQPCRN
jgi:molybdate transport system ATP-binding protein